MSSDVQVDAMGDHVRYYLPRRQLGSVRWLGLIPITFGLIALAITSTGFPHRDGSSNAWTDRLFSILIIVLLLMFCIPIWRLIVIGLVVIAGRTEIRLINGKLSARERAGPVFWTRKFKKKTPIERVSVGYGNGTMLVNGKPTDHFKQIAGSAALGVEVGPEKKDRFMLTIGYPKEILLPIGQDLAQRLHVGFREGLMNTGEWFERDIESAESES